MKNATPTNRSVDVLPPGQPPGYALGARAQFCRLAVHRPQGGDTVVILSVIDNLVKGAAGQGGAEHEPDVRPGTSAPGSRSRPVLPVTWPPNPVA